MASVLHAGAVAGSVGWAPTGRVGADQVVVFVVAERLPGRQVVELAVLAADGHRLGGGERAATRADLDRPVRPEQFAALGRHVAPYFALVTLSAAAF